MTLDSKESLRPWQLVTSTAGRDAGHMYLVLRIGADGIVELVDGERRRVESPKRKNLRHLSGHQQYAGDLAERVAGGGGVRNTDVRAALEQLVCAAGLTRAAAAAEGKTPVCGQEQT